MRETGLSRSELNQIEARLRATIVSFNKRNLSGVTMIEAVDDAAVWPQVSGTSISRVPDFDLDSLLERWPLLICAIASEIGFDYQGVGTIFWAHFDAAIGQTASVVQRQRIADVFRAQAERYDLSRPESKRL